MTPLNGPALEKALLPCPFCGSRRVTLGRWGDERLTVSCEDCDIDGPEGACPDEVTAAWNRRVLSGVELPGWRDIETAPKDGTWILASGINFGTGPGRHYAIARWDEGAWREEQMIDGEELAHLTHWQLPPLAPPPPVTGDAPPGEPK